MTDLPIVYNTPGSTLYFSTQFTKADGTGTAPASVSVIITDPDGTATTYTYTGGNVDPNEVVSDGSGAFHIALQPFNTVKPSGVWNAVWVGAGGLVEYGTQVLTEAIRVTDVSGVGTGMLTAYFTIEELKSRLGMDQDDTKDDYELRLTQQATTDWITTYTGRTFYQINETRTFRPDNVWDLFINDVVSISSFKLDYDGDGVYETTWVEGTEYQLLRYMSHYNQHDLGTPRPYNQVQVLSSGPPSTQGGQWLPWVWPFTRQDRVQITGIWGWPSVPANVTMAALYVAAEMFMSKNAPFGMTGIADLGVIKIQASPWVVELLRPYIDMRGKVGV